MKKRFVVEIETENEENRTTAKDIHLALVMYFVTGVYIHVEEAAQQSVQADLDDPCADCGGQKIGGYCPECDMRWTPSQ